jgi:hypothetical protein
LTFSDSDHQFFAKLDN